MSLTGFDIDTIEWIAERLGFTYTIHLLTKLSNETWDEFAYRATRQTDLMLSYWLQTEARRSRMLMLNGHIDGRCP